MSLRVWSLRVQMIKMKEVCFVCFVDLFQVLNENINDEFLLFCL